MVKWPRPVAGFFVCLVDRRFIDKSILKNGEVIK